MPGGWCDGSPGPRQFGSACRSAGRAVLTDPTARADGERRVGGMKWRYLGSLVLIVAGAGALLFGTRLEGRPPPLGDSLPVTSQQPAETPPAEALTDPERDWCDTNPGRVANSAQSEYMAEGAPRLLESERLSGSLRATTLEQLLVWRDENPDLYAEACRDAFATWAGYDLDS